jgi:EmrB/QacA subfamily drug resistance transporter
MMPTHTRTDTPPGGIKQHLPVLIVLMVGLFLAILNQTLLNVALPHITSEFNITTNTSQWLLTGYMMINGVLIPLSAFLIERFGVRKLFLAAMVCFTLGAFLCSIAGSFPIMLTGRLIQAAGGGILSPLVMSVILYIFPPEKRGKGMGIFGLAMMFAPAVGPTLSGWVVENYDWHLLFSGMIPFGIIVLIVSFFTLRNIEQPKIIKLDYLGTVSSLIGVGLLLYGLSEAGAKGWGSATVVSCIIAGLIFIVFFVVWQMKSENPLLNMRVFRYDIFSLSNVVSALVTASMYAGMLLLPIYLQNLRGFTPLESGLLMLPGALVMLAMSPVSGILFDKIGPRPLAIIGMVITTLTTYEFTHLTLQSSYVYILVLYMLRYFGMSFLMMPIMTAGMNQLPRDLNKHGTAMSNTLRQVSGSIGTSVITTIFTTRANFHYNALADRFDTTDPTFMQTFSEWVNKIAAAAHITSAQAQMQAASTLATQAKMESTVQGINDAFYWTTIISIVGLILSVFLRDVRKDKLFQTKAAPKSEILMLPSPKEA